MGVTNAALKRLSAFYPNCQQNSTAQATDTHIQVDDLSQERTNHKYDDHVSEPLVELRFPASLCHYSSTKPLRADNAQAPYETAYRKVYQHTLFAVLWRNEEYHAYTTDNDDAGIGEKARCDDVALHFLDIGHGTLLRRIQQDDNRAQDRQKAARFPHKAEAFFEKDRGENSGNNDRKCTQWSDHDCIHKRISLPVISSAQKPMPPPENLRCEIAQLPHYHQRHARPPERVLEISISFTSLLIILDVGLQQSHLLQHERRPNEQSRAHGENYTYRFVYWGSSRIWIASGAGGSSSDELVCRSRQVLDWTHGAGALRSVCCDHG